MKPKIKTALAAVAILAASLELSDTSWVVESVRGAGTIDASQTTLRFAAEGNLNGTLGCNMMAATVTRGSQRLL